MKFTITNLEAWIREYFYRGIAEKKDAEFREYLNRFRKAPPSASSSHCDTAPPHSQPTQGPAPSL